MPVWDAVVVGAGPNGLACAITLAKAGKSVLLLEAAGTVGGGVRSAELTLPGFVHDVCSAIHPLGVGSPFFESLPLADYGLEWIHPPAPLAQTLEGGRAVVLERDVGETAEQLGRDGAAYRGLMNPEQWEALRAGLMNPLAAGRRPLAMARFGLRAILPASFVARRLFRGQAGRTLFAGLAAHSMLPLQAPVSSGFGQVLGIMGHAVGWPFPKGGSQRIADALAAFASQLGVTIETGTVVRDVGRLPEAKALFFDVTPRQLLRIAGERLSMAGRKALHRFRQGPGVFKMDFALSGPVPWAARECARAATVHVGGSFEEIEASEGAPAKGLVTERPFLLVAQQSLFDGSRAPAGAQTLWAYCHVPFGSGVDMTERIERQIERFAPGFRDCILAKHAMGPPEMQAYNENYVGGDIGAGSNDWRQTLTRPYAKWNPYKMAEGLYLCSASTPPGAGVHGLCGYHAASSALAELLK